ncbi:MAG: malonyl-CoA decarboxylase [Bacteroidales bacterium]|nr:malonyl-CoA decarboxylase [Bacteroidales bacterium]
MNIGRFTKNLVDTIADAGENFLNLKRLRGTPTQKFVSLCDDLISHKGMASGLALSRQVVKRYRNLSHKEKLWVLKELNRKAGPDMTEIQSAAKHFIQLPNEENLSMLSKKLKTNRRKLFSRMIMASEGAHVVVKLREDLLGFIPQHPELKGMDEDLKSLLKSWFNPGFLVLRKIDWNTEAAILEKIIEYEAVHDIKNWDDLKQRLGNDRRCFAYFHPSLEDEPLIFVEVALTKGISSSIQDIFNAKSKGGKQADTAIFYSINNCQKGLRSIPLGNFLIKIVVMQLAFEMPSIKTYSTLSPVPGFAKWLKQEIQNRSSVFFTAGDLETLKIIDEDGWQDNNKKSRELRKTLINACAKYLVKAKKEGNPMDPVARFHFGNGAQLFRINWMGNSSENGIGESFGLMVNYLYDPRQIESNHEAYVQRGELSLSKSVKAMLAS